MAERPIISPDQVIGAAIDALVARRPAALSHINAQRGRYWTILKAWRAQAALNIQRIYDELMCSRLSTAEGRPLADLASSEFFADLPTVSTVGIGVARVVTTRLGVLPAGTRFFQKADPAASPIARQAGAYVSTEARLLDTVGGSTDVPIVATTPGVAPDIVIESGVTPAWVTIDPTYDSTATVTWAYCAGGSGPPDDPHIRTVARAQPMGDDGPTLGAIVAGALMARGVRHLAVIADPNYSTIPCLLLADESWSWSQRWADAIVQDLFDAEFAGFGCSVTTAIVDNVFVRVAPTIQLTDWKYLSDTEDVTKAVAKAVRSYFDDRPNWNVWSLGGLRAAITAAHEKILTCTAVAVTDRNNNPLSPPPGLSTSHCYLLNDGLLPTYQAPA